MTSWPALVLQRLRSPVLDVLGSTPGVWVVGGAVRDALLDRPPRELDLVVEGDAMALARRLGTPDAVHERFGTATVAGMDVVAARRESYARPGALPDVELGVTVEEDLARRDFSVNAIAVRLVDGRGVAWPGALDDLSAGVLRVLHPRSFLDDPTRLLRLVRYGARLDFAPDADTARLAASAVGGGAVGTVSGSRLGAELRLALREPLPEVLVRLASGDLGGVVVHRAFAPQAELLESVLAVLNPPARAPRRPEGPMDASAVPALAPPGVGDPGLACLGACLLDAPPDEVRAVLDRLAFPAAERAVVTAAAGGRQLAVALLAARTASQVAAAARPQPLEALAVAAALGAAQPVRRWLTEWRHVRLSITGDDLLAAGLRGPAVGAGLRAARDAALDGRAPDREAQLRAARKGVA